MSTAQVVVLAGPSGAGKSRLAERLGLPVLRLDDFYNTDLSLTKYFNLPRGQRIQFRAEAFNAFNNVNFTNVSLDANSPNSFGQFTAASPARVMQFALRYEF